MTLGWGPPPAPGFPSCRKSPSPHAVLTTPVDRFWYCSVGSRFPAMGFPSLALAFPERTAGRHPHLSFRGLLELSLTLRPADLLTYLFNRLGRKAPTPAVTGLRRFSATQSYRQFLGRDFHPLVVCALRAHVRFRVLLFSKAAEAQPEADRSRRTRMHDAHCGRHHGFGRAPFAIFEGCRSA
jgi:ribosomal protein S14